MIWALGVCVESTSVSEIFLHSTLCLLCAPIGALMLESCITKWAFLNKVQSVSNLQEVTKCWSIWLTITATLILMLGCQSERWKFKCLVDLGCIEIKEQQKKAASANLGTTKRSRQCRAYLPAQLEHQTNGQWAFYWDGRCCHQLFPSTWIELLLKTFDFFSPNTVW